MVDAGRGRLGGVGWRFGDLVASLRACHDCGHLADWCWDGRRLIWAVVVVEAWGGGSVTLSRAYVNGYVERGRFQAAWEGLSIRAGRWSPSERWLPGWVWLPDSGSSGKTNCIREPRPTPGLEGSSFPPCWETIR